MRRIKPSVAPYFTASLTIITHLFLVHPNHLSLQPCFIVFLLYCLCLSTACVWHNSGVYTNCTSVMAPGILSDPMTSVRRFARSPQRINLRAAVKSCLFGRSVNDTPGLAVRGERNSYFLDDGTEVYDASGGAAVANIGKLNKSVDKARRKVRDQGLCYVPFKSFETESSRNLANWMIQSTDGMMRSIMFYGSGTICIPYSHILF
jgi:hypothetical protein